MLASYPFVPLARLVVTFLLLLIGGILLAIPLYHYDYYKFIRSTLFVKIMFWIPIFLLFVAFLYLSNPSRFVFLLLLLAFCLSELRAVLKKQRPALAKILIIYFIVFAAALMHFFILGIVYPPQATSLLIIICFASVLSDVTAFFMGNYLGRHKLPAVLNNSKSWEGVLGQVLGAFIGVWLVHTLIVNLPLQLFIPIGVGSAVGDLCNSYIKRLVGIKDWSNKIPGHGGYLDRLASLAGSVLFAFYYLKLSGII